MKSIAALVVLALVLASCTAQFPATGGGAGQGGAGTNPNFWQAYLYRNVFDMNMMPAMMLSGMLPGMGGGQGGMGGMGSLFPYLMMGSMF